MGEVAKETARLDLRKLRKAQSPSSKALLARAGAALASGDIVLLDELKRQGFNPWRSGVEGANQGAGGSALAHWGREALRDPSCKSLEWLAKSFEGFLEDLPSCSAFWSASEASLSLIAPEPAVALLDMYRPQGEAANSTIRQLCLLPQFPRLLELLLELSWFERYWHTPVADTRDPDERWGKQNGWDQCAFLVAHGQKNKVPAAAQRRLTEALLKNAPPAINLKTLREAISHVAAEGGDIEPFARLADLVADFPEGAGVSQKRVNAGPREQWRERVTSFLSGRFYGRERELDLGTCVLLGGNPESIRCALDRGWIAPIKVEITLGCENPAYAAYDKARLEAGQGRSLDMSARFQKIERVIEASELDPGKKKRLLESLSSAPDECPPREQWRLSLPSSMMMSPQVAIMSRSADRLAARGEEAARALSEAGFLLSEGVEQAKWIGCAQKERRPGWLTRALELEAIRLATGPALPRSKRSGL